MKTEQTGSTADAPSLQEAPWGALTQPMNTELNRRQFLQAATAAGAGLALAGPQVYAADEKLAVLGGQPVRTQPFPAWPVMDELEERALLDVLHSGKWFRGYGETVNRFEEAYAKLTGAKYCVATANAELAQK